MEDFEDDDDLLENDGELDPTDDDGEGDETPDDEDEVEIEGQQQTRKDKKRQRGKLWRALNESRNELAEARRREQELSERLARLEGSVLERDRSRDRTDDEDEIDPRLEALQDEHARVYNNFIRIKDPTEAQKAEYTKAVRKIEQKKLTLAAKIVMEKEGVKGGDAAAREALAHQIRVENQDVYSNQRAYQYAEAYFRMKIAEGVPDSKELLDESMNAARAKFNLSPKMRPTQERRDKYMGTPRRSSGGSGGDGGGRAPLSIKMSKELRQIARSMFPNIPEEEAYRKWANSPAGRETAKEMQGK